MYLFTNEVSCLGNNERLSTATKEMDNPEDTAEKVGISALIVQVNNYRTTDLNLNLELSQVTVCYNTNNC